MWLWGKSPPLSEPTAVRRAVLCYEVWKSLCVSCQRFIVRGKPCEISRRHPTA